MEDNIDNVVSQEVTLQGEGEGADLCARKVQMMLLVVHREGVVVFR